MVPYPVRHDALLPCSQRILGNPRCCLQTILAPSVNWPRPLKNLLYPREKDCLKNLLDMEKKVGSREGSFHRRKENTDIQVRRFS